MMSHVLPLASWFPWMNIPRPREPLWKGLDEAAIGGFSIKFKINEKLIYFYSLSVNCNNRSPVLSNYSQIGIHCHGQATIIYELTKDIVLNNIVAQLYFWFTLTWSFNIIYSRPKIDERKNMHLLCKPFRRPCGSGGTMPTTLPSMAGLGLP